MIEYGRHYVDDWDIEAVVSVLKSDALTQGQLVRRFEEEIAKYCGARHGVSTNSATSALHIACLALGLKSGDILWTSPNTFVASANCGLYCGAEIDFVDIDIQTGNMSVRALEEKLISAEKRQCLPKIIVAVHFSGRSCDMREIRKLADCYGVKLIEDASHALGAEYLGDKVGSCRFSHCAILSFHPVKMITTGEGGMVLCNDERIREQLIKLCQHGIERDKAKFSSRRQDEIWNYQQVQLGFNFRMSEISAALGLSQLGKLDQFLAKRTLLADAYHKRINNMPLKALKSDSQRQSSYHIFPVRLLSDFESRKVEIYTELRKRGVGVNVHYIPVHRHPFFESKGFREGDFPAAEAYFRQAFTLPLFYELTETQVDWIVDELDNVLSREY